MPEPDLISVPLKEGGQQKVPLLKQFGYYFTHEAVKEEGKEEVKKKNYALSITRGRHVIIVCPWKKVVNDLGKTMQDLTSLGHFRGLINQTPYTLLSNEREILNLVRRDIIMARTTKNLKPIKEYFKELLSKIESEQTGFGF